MAEKPVCEHEPFIRFTNDSAAFVVSFACSCVKCGEVVPFVAPAKPKRHLRLVT